MTSQNPGDWIDLDGPLDDFSSSETPELREGLDLFRALGEDDSPGGAVGTAKPRRAFFSEEVRAVLNRARRPRSGFDVSVAPLPPVDPGLDRGATAFTFEQLTQFDKAIESAVNPVAATQLIDDLLRENKTAEAREMAQSLKFGAENSMGALLRKVQFLYENGISVPIPDGSGAMSASLIRENIQKAYDALSLEVPQWCAAHPNPHSGEFSNWLLGKLLGRYQIPEFRGLLSAVAGRVMERAVQCDAFGKFLKGKAVADLTGAVKMENLDGRAVMPLMDVLPKLIAFNKRLQFYTRATVGKFLEEVKADPRFNLKCATIWVKIARPVIFPGESEGLADAVWAIVFDSQKGEFKIIPQTPRAAEIWTGQ